MFGFGSGKPNEQASTTSSTGTVPIGEMGGSNKVKQLKQQVRQEMSVAHATELVQTMTKHCFDSCIQTPGEALTSNQQKCTSQCMSLYTQVFIISTPLVNLLIAAGLERDTKVVY